ncbi:MAG: 50S ribosomal protein L22 [Bryobacterales bacterium]|jgi:large subunit ribosomal protein L22|nr:50S ribosomal protein L22 [Bryobacterales bacterium]MDE0296203.1 50S ribosomal protein L22 [Bryobacterales bacterium]MDE0436546.1 50S ribosomal protein L22 [Bryobacterales bacterium]
MQATAKMNYARVSPQKARLVVDQIRGRSVGEALTILRMTNKRVAPQIEKVLRSAMANAENNNEADVDELFVKEAYVNEGPRLKRLRPAPMGRAHRYVHHLSHIIVVVSDGQEEEVEEPQEE